MLSYRIVGRCSPFDATDVVGPSYQIALFLSRNITLSYRIVGHCSPLMLPTSSVRAINRLIPLVEYLLSHRIVGAAKSGTSTHNINRY